MAVSEAIRNQIPDFPVTKRARYSDPDGTAYYTSIPGLNLLTTKSDEVSARVWSAEAETLFRMVTRMRCGRRPRWNADLYILITTVTRSVVSVGNQP